MGIEQKIKKIVSEHIGVEESEISLDSHLQDDLNSDPLSMADLVVSLEDAFKLNIPSEDSLKFATVGDIVDYITDKIGEV